MNLQKKFIIFALMTTVSICFSAEQLLISEIRSISSSIAESLSDAKKVIAITDFTDLEGNVTDLGRFFAEEITVALASENKQPNIIDRLLLKKMMIDRGISPQGIIDSAFAKQIGEISGADVIITGTAYPISNSVYLSVKAIDINSSKIYTAASLLLSPNDVLDELIKKVSTSPESTSREQSVKTSFSPQVREAADFMFILQDISFNNNTIVLKFNITNSSDKTRYLTIKSVRTVDNKGKEYFPSSVIVGGLSAPIGEKGNISPTGNKSPVNNFDVLFESHQEIPARISFTNISSKTTTLGLLDMKIASVEKTNSLGTFLRVENKPSVVQFTNIDIPNAPK